MEGRLGVSVSWAYDSWFWLRSWSQGHEIEPWGRLCAEHGACLRFSFSPSVPLPCFCSLSLSLSLSCSLSLSLKQTQQLTKSPVMWWIWKQSVSRGHNSVGSKEHVFQQKHFLLWMNKRGHICLLFHREKERQLGFPGKTNKTKYQESHHPDIKQTKKWLDFEELMEFERDILS